ncbi:MAG: site-2 protease family protein, partial [Thermoguttaceae bacterium]|nr:site-2 protease family protein [Thermoguttaceae bacterium]
MGLLLFGLSWGGFVETAWYVALVVFGLGMLIFVHELGHFLVAKLCGVKVEKFYLGFDIAGLKLVKFVCGETEYGVGILPLGGYVKMLGQEDNPARLREEIERAKLQEPRAEGSAAGVQAEAPGPEAPTGAGQPPVDLAQAEQALFDPRSYLAQSVPERMAIISAGVVMNVLFAFLTGVLAYRLGVFQNACGVGSVAPGEAAWQEGLKPGDEIVAINGKPAHRFADLQHQVSLGDIEHGVPMVIRRPGVPKPLTVTLAPDRRGLAPTIGITSPFEPELSRKLPSLPGSAAAKAQPRLLGGDKLVKIGDTVIADYADVHRQLALHPEEPLTVTVERLATDGGTPAAKPGHIATVVGPQPMLWLGIEMGIGPIVAVQDDSPAASAGVEPDDLLVAIDGGPVGDPLTLADRLRRVAEKGGRVELALQRAGQRRTVRVAPRRPEWYETPFREKSPMSVPALGIAFEVSRRVEAVASGSPAEAAGVRPGNVVTQAKIVPPSPERLEALGYGDQIERLDTEVTAIDFEKHKVTWPFFAAYLLQFALPESRVELTLADG